MIFDIVCAIRYNRASMPPSTGGILSPIVKSGSSAEAKIYCPFVKNVFCFSLSVSLQRRLSYVFGETPPRFLFVQKE